MKMLIAGAALVAGLSMSSLAPAHAGCMGYTASPTAQTTTTATPVQTAEAPTATVAR